MKSFSFIHPVRSPLDGRPVTSLNESSGYVFAEDFDQGKLVVSHPRSPHKVLRVFFHNIADEVEDTDPMMLARFAAKSKPLARPEPPKAKPLPKARPAKRAAPTAEA